MIDVNKSLSEIPPYSHFVGSDTVSAKERLKWHSVHWPPQTNKHDAEAFAWCDLHVHHAWTATRDHLLFENEDDAVTFALHFGDTPST